MNDTHTANAYSGALRSHLVKHIYAAPQPQRGAGMVPLSDEVIDREWGLAVVAHELTRDFVRDFACRIYGIRLAGSEGTFSVPATPWPAEWTPCDGRVIDKPAGSEGEAS